MDRIDLYANPLPTFNIQGATKVSSCVGLSFSATLYLLILGYATSRLLILFGDRNPTIVTYEIDSQNALKDKVDLDKFGF